jgi:hypothetical protein
VVSNFKILFTMSEGTNFIRLKVLGDGLPEVTFRLRNTTRLFLVMESFKEKIGTNKALRYAISP